ncbi:GL26645 [Drosophila persimilis]|uniref:GL26645 n=1 Tax=Drosophila persimilis TaxID=7234 RepID=B4GT26_DROPE|nr:vitellogenin-1 isoform X2 [Drosophila persimilis]EDW25535.1 GL26645 [Drosophila persimilis]
MAFHGGVNAKGYFIPFSELTKGIKTTQLKTAKGKCHSEKSDILSDRFKGGTSQRSPTISGCTFQLTPKSDRIGRKKRRPKEDFHKDHSLSVKIQKSSPLSSSGKEVKKKRIKKIKTGSPGSSPSCGNPRKSVKRSLDTKNSSASSTPGKTFRIIKRSEIHKSQPSPYGNLPKKIKRSGKTRKSPASSSSGSNLKKKTRKSSSSLSPGRTCNKDSRMNMKRSPVMQKPMSSPYSKAVFRGISRIKANQSLQTRIPQSSSSSGGTLNKDPRMNRKKQSSESCKSTSTDEGFNGSKLMKTKESPNFNFSPLSSYGEDMNNDLMISLSPISECASSDDASPGGYRMTRQRSSDVHISIFESSPDSCISKKKRSLLDPTSDELRTRKKLLNLMHKSHLRTSTSVASVPENEDGDTPTNIRSPISQKGTPNSPRSQEENHLKENVKPWAWTYDDWLACKRRQRKEQQYRQMEERAARDFYAAQRKEISQMVYQMWLKNKKREEEAQRVQNHIQVAALNASFSLKSNPITVVAAAKPVRNISKEEINLELENWRLKKIQMQRSKRQEEQLAKIKHEEDLFHRQRQSEMAIKKWFSTVHTKPKPVPMNQGFDSLRGTISKLYINPQPWVQ